MDADVGIGLAVHHEGRGHVDIGVIEVVQLVFPVGVFKLQEEGAQRRHTIERLVAVRFHFRGRQFRSRLRGFPISALEAPSPESHLTTQSLARSLSFSRVQIAIAVLVVGLENLALFSHAAGSAGTAEAASPEPGLRQRR